MTAARAGEGWRLTVPDWIVAEVRYWIDIFNLEGWEIDISLERIVNEHADCMGWCERNARYNHAMLHFRTDIAETDAWRKVILHECLHIAMARVDDYVQEAMVPQIAESSQGFAQIVYTQHTESFVQTLTGSFWRYYQEQAKRERKKK